MNQHKSLDSLTTHASRTASKYGSLWSVISAANTVIGQPYLHQTITDPEQRYFGFSLTSGSQLAWEDIYDIYDENSYHHENHENPVSDDIDDDEFCEMLHSIGADLYNKQVSCDRCHGNHTGCDKHEGEHKNDKKPFLGYTTLHDLLLQQLHHLYIPNPDWYTHLPVSYICLYHICLSTSCTTRSLPVPV